MDFKEVGAIVGIASAILGGLFWIWKSAVKPVIRYVERFRLVEENIKAIAVNRLILDYHAKKIDAIIYLSDHAMFVCNAEGLCILANKVLCELFGATERQMRGTGWLNFLHEEDRKRALAIWEHAMDNDEDVTATYRVIHGETSEEIIAVYHAMIFRDENKQVIVSVGKAHQKQKQ